MQAAQNALLHRQTLVVLHEGQIDACINHLLMIVGFGKKTA